MTYSQKPWRANTTLTWTIVLSLTVATFGGLVAIASLAVGMTPWEAVVVRQVAAQPVVPTVNGALQVSTTDQICLDDNDCAWIGTRCDSCSCGDTVNVATTQRYEDQLKTLCADYRGAVCDYNCTATKPRCVNRRCVLAENPPQP
ncbi:MAG: hypothetical protein Q7S23_01715 [bacterium]|nr:hypothetical protein [bacterium]